MPYVLNDPFSVATLGWLTHSSLGIGTLGYIFEVEVDAATAASDGWFVRLNVTQPLTGPLSFKDADELARKLSDTPGLGNLAQVCSYVGARPGDPRVTPALKVSFIYLRGQRVAAGRRAEMLSKTQGPPTG
jgi:hypothetical protein